MLELVNDLTAAMTKLEQSMERYHDAYYDEYDACDETENIVIEQLERRLFSDEELATRHDWSLTRLVNAVKQLGSVSDAERDYMVEPVNTLKEALRLFNKYIKRNVLTGYSPDQLRNYCEELRDNLVKVVNGMADAVCTSAMFPSEIVIATQSVEEEMISLRTKLHTDSALGFIKPRELDTIMSNLVYISSTYTEAVDTRWSPRLTRLHDSLCELESSISRAISAADDAIEQLNSINN